MVPGSLEGHGDREHRDERRLLIAVNHAAAKASLDEGSTPSLIQPAPLMRQWAWRQRHNDLLPTLFAARRKE